MIAEVLDGLAKNGEGGNATVEAAVRAKAMALCAKFPIYSQGHYLAIWKLPVMGRITRARRLSLFSCSIRNSADAGNPAQQTHRYGTTYTLGRTAMPTKSKIRTLILQEIDLVAGGTSLSPGQLARGRATIKGTDGSSPEESASFLGKFIRGLIKL